MFRKTGKAYLDGNAKDRKCKYGNAPTTQTDNPAKGKAPSMNTTRAYKGSKLKVRQP